MQWFVEWTSVMATLLFMYLHVLEWGRFHFFTRRMDMDLIVASASMPRRPFTYIKKWEKWQYRRRQASRYLHVKPFS